MKTYVTILMSMLLLTSPYMASAQPPGDILASDPSLLDNNEQLPEAKCVVATVDIAYSSDGGPESANVLDLNCPDKTTIHIAADFDWTQWCLSSVCNFYFDLYICGNYVKSIAIDEKTDRLQFFFNVGTDLFDRFIDEPLPRLGSCQVELKLIRSCPVITGHGIVVKSQIDAYVTDIQIIDSQNLATSYYTADQIVGHYDGPNVKVSGIKACCCKPEISACKKNNLMVKIEDVKEKYSQSQSQSTTKNTISINAGIKAVVASPSGIFLNGSFEMAGSYNGSITWENAISQGIKETFKITQVNQWELEPLPESCVVPEYYIIFEKWERQKWEADCIKGDTRIATISTWDQPEILDGQIRLYFGGQVEVSGCGGGRSKSKYTKIAFFTTIHSNSCTGSLTLGDIQSDLDLASTQIWWTNEKSEVFKVLNLENVPYGRYTLHMEDQCCNSYTETRTLCPNETKGVWNKNEDKYCRNIKCGTSCHFTECVSPDRVEDVFDAKLKKCVKEYYYQNELLGTTSVDAATDTQWNDFFEQCETTYICNGQAVYSEDYDADDSQWIYDDWDESCRLTVDCRGMNFENVREVEPEITWAWDDFFEECVGEYVTCAGQEVDASITQEAYDVGIWDWGTSFCQREIKCIEGGSSFFESIPSDYEDTEVSVSCPSGQTLVKLICDGEVVDIVCSDVGLWQGNHGFFRRKLSKSPHVAVSTPAAATLVVQIDDMQGQSLDIHIYDVMGRLYTYKQFTARSLHETIYFSDVPSGLSIVSIGDRKEKIYFEKIYIQN